MKLRLRVRPSTEDEAPPIVCHFPHGPPPAASLPAEEGSVRAEVEVLRSTSKRRRDQRRVVAKLPRQSAAHSRAAAAAGFVDGQHIAYEGQNYSEGADPRVRSQYAVGVYHRPSGELRIVPAELIGLRPVREAAAVRLPEEDQATASLAGRQKLTQKFGSVRRKQELARYQLNALTEENMGSEAAELMGTQIEKSARASAATRDAAAESYEKSRSFLPEGYDQETTVVEEVYPIVRPPRLPCLPPLPRRLAVLGRLLTLALQDSVIPPAARKFMSKHAKEFVARPPTGKKEAPGKFLSALLAARQSLAAEQAVELYYLHQMIRFASLEERGLKREHVSKALRGVPDAIVDLLIRSFTTGEERLSKSKDGMEDKLRVHLLILALHVSSFTIEPADLAEDLKVTPMRLVIYCRELGCKVKSQPAPEAAGGKRYRAALQAPLKFPEPPRKRQRRG